MKSIGRILACLVVVMFAGHVRPASAQICADCVVDFWEGWIGHYLYYNASGGSQCAGNCHWGQWRQWLCANDGHHDVNCGGGEGDPVLLRDSIMDAINGNSPVEIRQLAERNRFIEYNDALGVIDVRSCQGVLVARIPLSDEVRRTLAD